MNSINDEDKIPIRRVSDRRRWKRNDGAALPHYHARLDEHPRKEFTVFVREGRLDVDIAGGLIDNGVDRRDLAPCGDSRYALDVYIQLRADMNIMHLLLGNGEVHIDRDRKSVV